MSDGSHPNNRLTQSGEPAGTGHPRTSFNPYVHGARGVFSAMVLIFHVSNSGLPTFYYPGAAWVSSFLLAFKFSVELFFGISGIVILGALARARSLYYFAWDRFTRIYPVLWATLVCLIGLRFLSEGKLIASQDLVLNFTVPPPWINIRQINPAAWSLSFELYFYVLCVFGWLFRRLPLIRPMYLFVGISLIALFPRTMLMLPGTLIGIGMLRNRAIYRLARYPATMVALFLLSWRILEIFWGKNTGTLSIGAMPFTQWVLYAPGLAITGVLGAAALLGIFKGHGWLGRFLATPTVQWLGTISYSFYLWHPIVLAAVKRGPVTSTLVHNVGAGGQLLLLMLALPSTLLVAFVSQQLIEKRFTRWLRGLVESRPKAPLSSEHPSPSCSQLHSPHKL